MRTGLVLLLCSALLSPAVSAGDEVRVSSFLQDLAEQHGFKVQGLDIVGADSFEPAPHYRDVEVAVARALRHFNHVISYQQGQPVLVSILGRKGNDVGALPDYNPEVAVQEGN